MVIDLASVLKGNLKSKGMGFSKHMMQNLKTDPLLALMRRPIKYDLSFSQIGLIKIGMTGPNS